MRSLRVLLSLAALCLSLSCILVAAAPQQDCRLSNLELVTSLGTTYVLTPQFNMDTTAYTLTVPFAVTWVKLTGTTLMQGNYYIGYSATNPSSPTTLQAVGNPVKSGTQSPQLDLMVGDNKVGALTTCSSCRKLYTILITRDCFAYTKGDPLFAGLLGQQFQVHGVAGEVYSVISDPQMQMNSRFVFLTHGDCPVLHGKKAHACWSHPGSYLGEIGIKTAAGQRLHLASGSAKHGFAKVELDGKPLEMDEVVALPAATATNGRDGFVVRNSTHLVTVQVSNFLLQIENSDHFVNYRVRVLGEWAALRGTHGLLGQTYQKPLKPGKQIKEIEGDVDNYVINDKDLFGDDFVFNRFGLNQPTGDDQTEQQ